MTIQLPEDLERYLQAQVSLGRFASADEAVGEAVRLLRQRQLEQGNSAPLTEEELDRRLLDEGLMAGLPKMASSATSRKFQPIQIEGEALSETIIRERR